MENALRLRCAYPCNKSFPPLKALTTKTTTKDKVLSRLEGDFQRVARGCAALPHTKLQLRNRDEAE